MRAVAVVAALAVGAAGAVGGYLIGSSREPDAVTSTVVRATTTTVTSTVAAGLPEAVEEKRQEILAAAEAKDYDALRELIPDTGFTFSYGASEDPIAYWQELEANGEQPLETLATVLKLPYDVAQGHYVWPFAYSLRRPEMTPYERELLGDLARTYVGDSYFGYRAGINPDGDWVFFVAGD